MQELIPATDTEADLLRHISKEPVHTTRGRRESGYGLTEQPSRHDGT
jgi:hypothetical protein